MSDFKNTAQEQREHHALFFRNQARLQAQQIPQDGERTYHRPKYGKREGNNIEQQTTGRSRSVVEGGTRNYFDQVFDCRNTPAPLAICGLQIRIYVCRDRKLGAAAINVDAVSNRAVRGHKIRSEYCEQEWGVSPT